MTWIWWTLGVVVIGAAALVVIVGAMLLAVIIAEAMNNDGTDEY